MQLERVYRSRRGSRSHRSSAAGTDRPVPSPSSAPCNGRPSTPSFGNAIPDLWAPSRTATTPSPRPVQPLYAPPFGNANPKSGHLQRSAVRALPPPPRPPTRAPETYIPTAEHPHPHVAATHHRHGVRPHPPSTPTAHQHGLSRNMIPTGRPPRARHQGFSATKHPHPCQAPPTYGGGEIRPSDRFPVPVRRVIRLPGRADAGLRAGAPAPPVVQSHHHRVGRHVVAHHGPRPLRSLHACPHPGS